MKSFGASHEISTALQYVDGSDRVQPVRNQTIPDHRDETDGYERSG